MKSRARAATRRNERVSLGLPNSTWKESFMKIEMSTKARERLLYLISPLGLIIIWQILLMVGIGDRRFIPAPSDIAPRFAKPPRHRGTQRPAAIPPAGRVHGSQILA